MLLSNILVKSKISIMNPAITKRIFVKFASEHPRFIESPTVEGFRRVSF
jgi:hypothetical protein